MTKLTPPLNIYSELELMLAMRACGYSYTVLADHFSVPKTTIRYLSRKFGLAENAVQVTVIRKHTTSEPRVKKYAWEDDEPINPGKNYAQYLREAEDRKKHQQA